MEGGPADGARRVRHRHRRSSSAAATPNRINPWTGLEYSESYRNLLEERRALPVWGTRDEIMQTVRDNRVTIIEGATGSGKTTQIPQFLLEGHVCGPSLRIVCTQPRRIAAITVATRVASEMDVELGDVVGYAVRFDMRSSERTVLRYETEGLLLKEFIADPKLSDCGIVVLDEAHERTVQVDIILGLLRSIEREDLRVVVMSATLNGPRFSEFFGGAPLLGIPGRQFPIEIVHSKAAVRDYLQATVERAVEIARGDEDGDVLVFLTGEEEIESACGSIRAAAGGCLVLPCYASLDAESQRRVFRPATRRKIVVATNIAETSVTIPGVRFVIDCGFVKRSRFLAAQKVSTLLAEPISQAAATQRAGRAGRTCSGRCFRLYTQATFAGMAAETPPDIVRSDLSAVVLEVLSCGVRDLVRFAWVDPPELVQMARAVEELYFLRFLDESAQLTADGRAAAVLPLDPRAARCLLSADGCVREMATLVALATEQGSVWARSDPPVVADREHARFRSGWGDHLSMLNAFEGWCAAESRPRFAEERYLNARVLVRVLQMREQLVRAAEGLGLRQVAQAERGRESRLMRALLRGFFQQVAMLSLSSGGYVLLGQTEVQIHPHSALCRKPEWIVFNSCVFTARGYVRCVGEVMGEWLVEDFPEFFDPARFPEGAMRRELARLRNRRAAA